VGRLPRIPALIAALAASAACLAACGGSAHHGIPANAVAAVEGQPVTEAEVNHWLRVAALKNSTGALAKGAVAPDPPTYAACVHHLEEVAKVAAEGHKPNPARLKSACEEQYKVLRARAISFLLTTQWAFQEAKAKGVSVSDAEVQKAFEKLKAEKFSTPQAEQALLQKTGETRNDILLQERLNLITEKISQKVTEGAKKVSDKEIEEYFRRHQSEFGPKETRDVRLILLGSKAGAEQVKKQIEAGGDPAKIANERTIETAGKGSGGLFAETAKGERPEAIDKAIFSAKEHQLGGPVKVLLGYYIYEVLKIRQRGAQSLAEVRDRIKNELAHPRVEQTLKRFAAEFEKRWKQRTECRPGWTVPECKGASSSGTSGEASSSSEGQ
jgi:foldase protein PrsA